MSFESLSLPSVAETNPAINRMAALVKNKVITLSSNGSLRTDGSLNEPKTAANDDGRDRARYERCQRLLAGLRKSPRRGRRTTVNQDAPKRNPRK
jgi:hypothetical protein